MGAGAGPGGDGRAVGGPPPTAEVEALVRSLIEMMQGGNVTELDLAFGAVSIRLRGVGPPPSAPSPTGTDVPATANGSAEATPEHVITAPMIGTFYASQSPGVPPFVEVGDAIVAGQLVGIIEAMKIMNEITADRAGVVTAVLVDNAQSVEYGSPLLRLAVGGDGA